MVSHYLARRRARWRKSLAKRLGPRLAGLLENSAFFVQSQMDINPKSIWHRQDFIEATGGYQILGEKSPRTVGRLTPVDTVRRDALVLLLRSIVERDVPGDMAELGVWKGHTAKLFHDYAPERTLHLFDTFSGFDAQDVAVEKVATQRDEKAGLFSDTDVGKVLAFIDSPNDNVHVHPGRFPESFPDELRDQKFAFVNLDVDLFEPTKAGLETLFPRLSPGGMMVVHDYNAWQGVRQAVDTFFEARIETPVPLPDKCGSAVIVKIQVD